LFTESLLRAELKLRPPEDPLSFDTIESYGLSAFTMFIDGFDDSAKFAESLVTDSLDISNFGRLSYSIVCVSVPKRPVPSRIPFALIYS
jgi:hypothetical protein